MCCNLQARGPAKQQLLVSSNSRNKAHMQHRGAAVSNLEQSVSTVRVADTRPFAGCECSSALTCFDVRMRNPKTIYSKFAGGIDGVTTDHRRHRLLSRVEPQDRSKAQTQTESACSLRLGNDSVVPAICETRISLSSYA